MARRSTPKPKATDTDKDQVAHAAGASTPADEKTASPAVAEATVKPEASQGVTSAGTGEAETKDAEATDDVAKVTEAQAAKDAASPATADETATPDTAQGTAGADTDEAAAKDTEGGDDAGKPAEPHAAAPADQPQEQPGGGDDGNTGAPAGDQDQAEAVAAEIVSGASDAPPSPEKADPDAGLVVRITGPKKGRWRIGRRFDRTPVEIPVSEITEDQAEALKADKTLTVEVVPAS